MQDKWVKFEEVDDVVPLAVQEVSLEPGGWGKNYTKEEFKKVQLEDDIVGKVFRWLVLGGEPQREAPNDTAYKRWSCHSGLKLLCKLCRTSPPPAMGARFTVFGHAGHADQLNGWRCCSQKRVMWRPIQVRQL